MTAFAFTSDKINIFAIADQMEQKGKIDITEKIIVPFENKAQTYILGLDFDRYNSQCNSGSNTAVT